MAFRGAVVLVMFLVAMPWARTMAQSACTNALISMVPCLNYVTGGSSLPSSSCCSQLASVVQSQPLCLCAVLNGGSRASLGLSINQTLALALPDACNVQTPPINQCNAAKGPASALSPSASGSPLDSPGVFPVPGAAADGPGMSPLGSPIGSPEAQPAEDGPAMSSFGSPPVESPAVLPSNPLADGSPISPFGSSVESPIPFPSGSSIDGSPISSFGSSVESPITLPTGPSTDAEAGSKAVPSTTSESGISNGVITELPLQLVLVVALIASYALTAGSSF